MIEYYSGLFKTKEDIAHRFEFDIKLLDKCKIIYASYTYENYSGAATVIYKKKTKYYLVQGSHCSCYGLEGQWTPEEYTKAQMIYYLERYDSYILSKFLDYFKHDSVY